MQVPRSSRMTLDWIQRACQQNPPKKIMDPSTGQFTGSYSTGPVRLSWTDQLFKPRKNDAGVEQYGVTCLFPPSVDLSLLFQATNEAGMSGWPDNMTANGFQWAGLQSPWHDQAEKANKYKGYTPGAYYFNTSTQFKPRIVDPSMNDIVDENRVYPGVWAILAVNCYPYGNRPTPGRPTKKGVSFGLQSTVIIADDEKLGGAGLDPKKAFAGIDLQGSTNIAAAFNVTPPIGTTQPPSAQDELRRLGLIS